MKANDCQTCQGERWVCENHPDLPWSSEGCQCSAGVPCPACNPCDLDNPPTMPPGLAVLCANYRKTQ